MASPSLPVAVAVTSAVPLMVKLSAHIPRPFSTVLVAVTVPLEMVKAGADSGVRPPSPGFWVSASVPPLPFMVSEPAQEMAASPLEVMLTVPVYTRLTASPWSQLIVIGWAPG